jgi:beta-lactamase regulating signal transducer with metallopeptidase domain
VFVLRGIAVSSSVFVLVYCVLSFAVCFAWRSLWLSFQKYPARRIADWLFTLRIVPFVSAWVITAVFAVPSFLLLEPRTIEEPVGAVPFALGLCGLGLGISGAVNAMLATRRASRAIAEWTRQAQPIQTKSEAESIQASVTVPVLRIAKSFPAMIAAGIARPRILVSGAAESQLSSRELQTALNHEVEHVRRRDNLKKLLMRFVAFPGMAELEAAWLEATEMAADDAAVANASEALDLAAALIKLSRMGAVESPVDLTAALLHTPASVVNARVERLIAWSDERRTPATTHRSVYGMGAILATVLAFAVSYSQLLVQIHSATEWLMR